MKALDFLKCMRKDTPCEQDELDEAIAELEALQQPKSCESCKHWKVRNKLVRSNECFKLSGSIMTPRDFYCSEFEAKEQ